MKGVTKVVYLDQNQWIELARTVHNPASPIDDRDLLEALRGAVSGGQVVVPLSSTNLYETYKIRDFERREKLARLQTELSGGLVFRGRHKRLEIEITDVLRLACGLPTVDRSPIWFLSDIFFESTAELGDPRLGLIMEGAIVAGIRRAPAAALFDYLVSDTEADRCNAVLKFSAGAAELMARIEARRFRLRDGSKSELRRGYAAMLVSDDLDLILKFAQSVGLTWGDLAARDGELIRKIVEEVPLLYIERELALRLDSQARAINENDMRDMQAYGAALRYADIVVGENQFINLARQSRLGAKYETFLATKLDDIRQLL